MLENAPRAIRASIRCPEGRGPQIRAERAGAHGCILASMLVRVCSLLVVLVAGRTGSKGTSPANADPLEEARRLFNERGRLAGADFAAAAFARNELPREKRLGLGLFASNSYALTYQGFPEAHPGDPIYLCKALAMLEASEGLATEPKELERHRRLMAARRDVLQKNHPDHRCGGNRTGATDDELLPVPSERGSMDTAAKAPRTASVPVQTTMTTFQGPPPTVARSSPSSFPGHRRTLGMTAVGGTALGLGVLSFAVMGGAVVVREDLRRWAADFGQTWGTEPTPEQEQWLRQGYDKFERADRVAIATGVVGSVMMLTGITMMARGLVLRGRMRVAPELGVGRVAFAMSGRF